MAAAFYRDLEPEDLPVPNKQIMQLIQYTLRDDADVDMLSRLISVNPALTAQLLGLVNSAFFGFRQNIQTISDAVVSVGMESLRNLVLCFAVKEAMSKREIPGFNIDLFWEDSIRRGVAAQQFAYLVNGPVEKAFTAGMLQDIGLLVLFSIEVDKVDRWPLLRCNIPAKRHEMEQELFQITHDDVGSMLIKKWNLPQTYSFAIASHHQFFSKKENDRLGAAHKQTVLSAIMFLADLCNAVYTCHDKSLAVTGLKKKSRQLFKLSDDQVDMVLQILPEQVAETSQALNMNVSDQTGYDVVMQDANRKLVDDNISYQELTWQLQRSLKERDEYAEKLENELDIAREIQKSLQPDIDQIYQVAAFNLPAYHLSGDFYDYFSKQDGTICFCLGDVSGKGTAAALLMAKAVSLFRCLCKVLDDISQIVHLMNNELCETAVRGMFVTFVGGWLNPETNEMEIVNVGHLPAFLVNVKGISKVEPSDPPLGVIPDVEHPCKKVTLENRRMYLYTDGFTEGRLKKGKPEELGTELGVKGFLRWLVQSRKMPLSDQLEWIKDQCADQLAPQSDDLTLMILSGEDETPES